jgi:hypothetical protein
VLGRRSNVSVHRRAGNLTTLLALLMLTQCPLALLLPDQYRDVEWIRATWLGNDWVTLVVAIPLLWLGGRRAAAGSMRGPLLWLTACTAAAAVLFLRNADAGPLVSSPRG